MAMTPSDLSPGSWTDCNMDWTDPDPFRFVYWIALKNALLERHQIALFHSGRSGLSADDLHNIVRDLTPGVPGLRLFYAFQFAIDRLSGEFIARDSTDAAEQSDIDIDLQRLTVRRVMNSNAGLNRYPPNGWPMCTPAAVAAVKSWMIAAKSALDAMTLIPAPCTVRVEDTASAYALEAYPFQTVCDHVRANIAAQSPGTFDTDTECLRYGNHSYFRDCASHTYARRNSISGDTEYRVSMAALPKTEIIAFARPTGYTPGLKCFYRVSRPGENYLFNSGSTGLVEGTRMDDFAAAAPSENQSVVVFNRVTADCPSVPAVGGDTVHSGFRIGPVVMLADYNVSGGMRFRA